MTSRRTAIKLGAAAIVAPMFNRGRFSLPHIPGQQYSARAIELMRRATVIDMLSPLHIASNGNRWLEKPDSITAADFEPFKQSGIHVFHTAVGFGGPNAYTIGQQYFQRQNAMIAARPDLFMRIDAADDFAKVRGSGRVGILLGAQNSDHFVRPDYNPRDMLATVDEFHMYGQRVSQLTYNSQNWFASGSTDRVDGGVSDFGAELIARMNKVGMAVDTSHCGDKTTLDALALSKKPALITHSNVRALANNHPRCKPDEVIRAAGKAGSVMGITGVRMFVKGSEPTTVEDFFNHIDYVAKMIGVEHVGIGSDIDLQGYDDMPPDEYKRLKDSYKGSYGFRDKIDIEGIDHPRRMFDVTEGLIRRKYTDDQILGILGGNFQRVLTDIWAGMPAGK
ncbi:MAG: membrane dipeptidase [Gemmatimonadetes bacterium]|nr:membrane dipeptidase [Gemmatimonadota bacterium]